MLLKIALRVINIHSKHPRSLIFLNQGKKMSTTGSFQAGAGPSWRPPPPCRVGDPLAAVDTPALLLDLPKMEKNLRVLPALMEKFPGVAWRPHAKAHKSPDLAKLQVKLKLTIPSFNS